MKKNKFFKGGHATVKSGGIEPDEYIFRYLPNGRYWHVIIRVKEGKEAYQSDLDGLSFVMQNRELVHLYDLQKRLDDGKCKGPISFTEFLDFGYPRERWQGKRKR
jgi:hypothetical protein